ncbi:MAG: hypothetical protein JOY71_05525 [Acetobacteraceae bacterium]|nr:hypothetical protein [Acetobacteraceae bacterium]
MSGITVATAQGGIATKQIRHTRAGLQITDYPLEKWWRFYALPSPGNVEGWADFLSERQADFASCCLYAEPINAFAGYQRRLIHDAEGAPATLREVARDYLVLDFDSTAVSDGIDFVTDPASAIGVVIDTFEELRGVAFALAVSASAGFKPGIPAKAVVMLSETLMPSAMRRRAQAMNARAGIKLLDPAVLAPAQPLYFAKLILHGIEDPIRQRVGMRAGIERASLKIPAERQNPEATGGVIAGSGGWRAHLGQLGGARGFHDVLLTAAGAVVGHYCGAPPEPAASLIHEFVRNAVLKADPGARDEREIARYASRRFWDDLIGHAGRREHHRVDKIITSIAGIRRA